MTESFGCELTQLMNHSFNSAFGKYELLMNGLIFLNAVAVDV